MMHKRAFLKPKPGMIVRFPTGDLLPVEGRAVLLTSYWRRRLRAGEVTMENPEAPKTETKQKKRGLPNDNFI
jgi:hypothetical protein